MDRPVFSARSMTREAARRNLTEIEAEDVEVRARYNIAGFITHQEMWSKPDRDAQEARDHSRNELQAALRVFAWVDRYPMYQDMIESPGEALLVWPWDKAPPFLQELSTHGGDEDWLMVVPANLTSGYIGWAESGGPFGCCDVDSVILPNGAEVRIGAHA